jgi:hypothetical protein
VRKGLATTGTSVGGHVKITALSGKNEATADLLVKLSVTLPDPTYTGPTAPMPLPADPASKFGGTMDATRAPQIVYPNDGVLLPPNLFGIEFHFRPGMATNTLFELGFKSEVLDLKVYTRCKPLGEGCLYEPSADAWKYLAQSSRGGDAVAVTIRGADDAGTGFGASASINLLFSYDEIAGGIYYWTTSGKTGIMRWDFGDRTAQKPELIIAGEQFTDDCVGCHALSRDGTKMIVSNGGQNDGRLLLFGVADKNPLMPYALGQRSQFETWSPDGKAFVGVYGDTIKTAKRPGEKDAFKDLLLFDGTTGAFTGTISAGGFQADHPDWSRDGKRIAFTTVGKHTTDQKSHNSGIASITFDGMNWSQPEVHLPIDPAKLKNRYYPAIAPDNTFFVFNESTCPAGRLDDEDCDMDMDSTATLLGLPFTAGAQPVELKNANAPGVADAGKTALTNSYPKWSPFEFQLSETRKLMWLTFTSRRAYGLRGSPDNRSLIWMVAIEPAALHAGKDPSFAAFALPFQDITTNNHIAQWTEKVVGTE